MYEMKKQGELLCRMLIFILKLYMYIYPCTLQACVWIVRSTKKLTVTCETGIRSLRWETNFFWYALLSS